MTKLQEFLDEKAEPGQFDSTGQFKLAGDKALKKLSAHSIQEPSLWVLKVVQAAVAARAQEIHLFHFRRCSRADILMETLPDPQQFQDALLKLEHGDNIFLSQLCIGLRPLLQMDYLRVIWLSPEHSGALQWNGRELVTSATHDPYSHKTMLRIEFPVSFFSFSARATETTLLQQRCRWCPIPLKLDGRLVNNEDNLPKSGFPNSRHGTDSPRYLASGWFGLQEDSKFTTAVPKIAAVERFQDPLRGDSPFLYWSQPRDCHSLGGFSVFCSYSFTSWVVKELLTNYGKREIGPLLETFYVGATRYGVLCAYLSSPNFGLGGEFIATGDDLRSDLTGLSLNLTPEWCEKVQEHLKSLNRVLKSTKAEISVHESRLTPADIAESLGFLGFGVLAGVVTAVVGIASGGLVSLAAPFVPFYFVSLAERDTPEVKKALPLVISQGMKKFSGPLDLQKWNLDLGEFLRD